MRRKIVQALLAVASFLIVTVGYPVAVDQGWVRYNPYILPLVVLGAVILCCVAFLHSDWALKRFGGGERKGRAMTFLSFIVIGACAGSAFGAGYYGLLKLSKTHIAELLSKENQPARKEPISQPPSAPTSPPALTNPPAPTPPVHKPARPLPSMQEAKVLLALVVGDDNATNVMITHPADRVGDLGTVFNCAAPFTCYSEDVARSQRIPLQFGKAKWRRLFFMVANIGNVVIPRPTVTVSSQSTAVSVYRAGQRTTAPQISFQLSPTENIDIIPYSESDAAWGYNADVAVDDAATDFDIVFRVFGANLKVRTLVAHITATRPTAQAMPQDQPSGA